MERKLSVLIVESDLEFARQTKEVISALDFVDVRVSFSYEEAKSIIRNDKPDLVVLDIHLNGQREGIELAKKCSKHNVLVIYTTADKSESVFNEAKQTFPVAYLVKPYSSFTLQSAIEAVAHLNKIDTTQATSKSTKDYVLDDSFFIKSGHSLYRIKLDTIKWISSDGNYCEISTDFKKHTVKLSLAKMSRILEDSNFVRVHQSTLIPLDRITNIDLNTNEIAIDNEIIAIGRSYRVELLKKLQRI